MSTSHSPDSADRSWLGQESNGVRHLMVIDEIIQTEVDLYTAINCAVQDYLHPAGVALFNSSLKDELRKVFCNIDKIAEFSRCFSQDLKECAGDPVQLCQCFIEQQEEFVDVYGQYVAQFPRSNAHLHAIKQRHTIKDYLIACELQRENRLSLHSELIRPIQRVLKYPLLLHSLAKCLTSLPSEDCAVITCAADAMTEVAARINHIKAEQEQTAKLQAQFTKWEYGDLQQYGPLMLEGQLKEVGSAMKRLWSTRERYGFLFQKLLLLCKANERDGTFAVKTGIEMGELSLTQTRDQAGLPCFEIAKSSDMTTSHTLQAASALETARWIKAIQDIQFDDIDLPMLSRGPSLCDMDAMADLQSLCDEALEEPSSELYRPVTSSSSLTDSSDNWMRESGMCGSVSSLTGDDGIQMGIELISPETSLARTVYATSSQSSRSVSSIDRVDRDSPCTSMTPQYRKRTFSSDSSLVNKCYDLQKRSASSASVNIVADAKRRGRGLRPKLRSSALEDLTTRSQSPTPVLVSRRHRSLSPALAMQSPEQSPASSPKPTFRSGSLSPMRLAMSSFSRLHRKVDNKSAKDDFPRTSLSCSGLDHSSPFPRKLCKKPMFLTLSERGESDPMACTSDPAIRVCDEENRLRHAKSNPYLACVQCEVNDSKADVKRVSSLPSRSGSPSCGSAESPLSVTSVSVHSPTKSRPASLADVDVVGVGFRLSNSCSVTPCNAVRSEFPVPDQSPLLKDCCSRSQLEAGPVTVRMICEKPDAQNTADVLFNSPVPAVPSSDHDVLRHSHCTSAADATTCKGAANSQVVELRASNATPSDTCHAELGSFSEAHSSSYANSCPSSPEYLELSVDAAFHHEASSVPEATNHHAAELVGRNGNSSDISSSISSDTSVTASGQEFYRSLLSDGSAGTSSIAIKPTNPFFTALESTQSTENGLPMVGSTVLVHYSADSSSTSAMAASTGGLAADLFSGTRCRRHPLPANNTEHAAGGRWYYREPSIDSSCSSCTSYCSSPQHTPSCQSPDLAVQSKGQRVYYAAAAAVALPTVSLVLPVPATMAAVMCFVGGGLAVLSWTWYESGSSKVKLS